MPAFFRNITALAFFGLLLAGGADPASALTVKAVRVGVHTGSTRIVLDLDGRTDFRAFALADPWRLVVDLPGFDWQAGAMSRAAGSGVTSLRQGSLQPGTSRIIFQLQKPAVIHDAFVIPGAGGQGARLVLDFAPAPADAAQAQKAHVFGRLAGSAKADHEEAAMPPPAPESKPEPETAASEAPPPPQHLTAPDASERDAARTVHTKHHETGAAAPPPAAAEEVAADADAELQTAAPPSDAPHKKEEANRPAPGEKPLIIIDPGHGGVDPGTIGAGGVYEKNVTLAAAKILKQELESTGRYRVMMTRDTDVYLRLHERVDFARQHKGDLFISLHADSSPVAGDVGGASIYTLSDTASDAETERLAMRENRADLVAGVDLSDQDDDVANILVDLAMRDTMNQSKFFANTVVSNMQSHQVRTLERTHRAAGFAVLKDPDVPSILVEMGFLSNPLEAQALSHAPFQHRLAETLTASIDAYFTKVRQNHRT